ncbi:hypothetical protein ACFQLX_21825 [Streptomyces polyrhachis]|uniref:Uncharacterized protein n=1 Tax=Streptomyces polyrhachis TaxID=1282885 RepID=A0ABW2GKT3_9ACTN
MAAEGSIVWEDEGDFFCVLSTYVKSDEAWVFELSEARPGPVGWASSGNAQHLPGRTAVTVMVHDEEVEKPPFVFFDGDQEMPFEMLRRFTEFVAGAIAGPSEADQR